MNEVAQETQKLSDKFAEDSAKATQTANLALRDAQDKLDKSNRDTAAATQQATEQASNALREGQRQEQARQKALDEAYAEAVHRQTEMRFVTTPREIAAQIERHVAARSLVRIEIPHPRNWLRRPRVVSWLLARRQLLRGIARRLGIG